MQRVMLTQLLAFVAVALMPFSAFAQNTANQGSPCPRPAAGSTVLPPPELFSRNGVLNVSFNYFTTVDSDGRTLFCFLTPNGLQSPTLHVNAGRHAQRHGDERGPAAAAGLADGGGVQSLQPVRRCDDDAVTRSTCTITAPTRRPPATGDEVIHTIINSGETFQYSLKFPTNEPPGLYWYHPHVHGIAEAAVQGGA